MASKRVLIVGGVAGGAACAARLRRLDEEAEIFLYERGADVSFANCGLPYYVGGVIKARQKLLLVTPEQFRDMFRIEVRTRQSVERIDRKQQTVEIRNVQSGALSTERYDALVLSPGAEPVRLPLPGSDLPGIFTLRNLEDVDRINGWIEQKKATRVVIVGAGYIGLEMLENFHRRGLSITVLERLDQIMAVMDPEMVRPVEEEIRRRDVDLRLGSQVTGFQAGPDGLVMVQVTGSEPIPAHLVIMAVGVRPDVKLAREAGLEIGPTGGIRVNEQMQTSDPAIWAVGDAVEVRDWVTGQPTIVPLAGPAGRQGRIAADVIAGRAARFRGTQGTGVVGLFGLTMALTGANEKTLQKTGMPYEKIYTHSLSHAGYYPGAEPMAIKLLFDPETGRILGAQAMGKEGVDKRIDVLAMAIQKQATVYDLEEAELCYAPQYGSARDPINIAGFAAANVLRGDVDVVHWEDWQRLAGSEAEKPLVVDVRPASAAAAESVPGTVNIPLGELRSRLGELPREREIWVHCAVGRTSYFAARILAQKGFRVRSLSGGITSYRTMPPAK